MAKQILVPLKGSDRIEEILPYIQDITRPGMAVVFLLPFGSNRFSELASQLPTINAGLAAILGTHPESNQISNVDPGIHAAADELRQRGVEIKFRFYAGPLQRVLRQFVQAEPDKCLIMRPVRNYLARSWQAIASALGFSAGPETSSMFLLSGLTANIRE